MFCVFGFYVHGYLHHMLDANRIAPHDLPVKYTHIHTHKYTCTNTYHGRATPRAGDGLGPDELPAGPVVGRQVARGGVDEDEACLEGDIGYVNGGVRDR